MSKELINLSNLQRFLSKLNEKFALKKAMKGISEDSEGNIIIGEEGLVPTPNENSKGKFLRSDGEWALPSETAVYDSMTLEEGVAGVSKVDRVINAKNLKQIVNSDGFLTSLDSSKLTGIINIENLPQGALERILIVSSKEERLTLLDSEVQLGDVVKESDTGLMYYVINTEKLNSEEGYTQFTAGSASSVPWSGVTDKPLIPTKTSELTNDSGYITSVSWNKVTNKPNFSKVATSGSYTDLSNTPAIPTKVSQLENDMGFGTGGDTSDCVHKTGNETIDGTKTFTASPFVSNYAVTNGFFTKLNSIARNEVPSQIYHSAFRVFDKNDKTLGECCVEKSTSGSSLLHMDVHTEDSEGNDIMESLYLNLSNDGSTVSFHPAKNNRTDLGMESNKWAKVYSDDVVHTSGDETINGTKTFTVAPFVSNNATTNGYFIKLNPIARNEVPTELYHATFRALDKNNKILGEYCVEKSTTGSTLAQMNVRSEDSNGKQLSQSLYFNMSNDGSTVSFYPNSNNKVHLGMPNNKWAKIYSDDVVHTSGNETIAGNKTFTNQMYLGGGSTSYGVISAKDNNSILRLFGGTSAGTGANLDLYGEGVSDGGFSLRARTSDKIVGLDGKTDGTLKWNGKDVALDSDVVHTSGNETINGVKTFTEEINIQKSDIDLTITPTSNKYSTYLFTDKNNKSLGVVQYAQRSTDVNDLDLYVFDKNSTAHGIQITTNNALSPIGNNYSLGSSSAKWANVYATTFNGNLKGNADTATKASCLDNYSLPGGNKIYLDWDTQVNDYVGLKVDNTNMGGLITTNNIGSQSVNSATYATSAASSTKATQDSAGQQINKTYIKELSVSGRTITYKRGDNTTGTITTQDTNTTYSKLSQFTNDTGFITSSGSCNYATSAGSANSVAWANVTGKPNLAGTTFVKGTNYWYRLYPDGFIEMGGFTNCGDKTGSYVTTNMPIAFSNTNYTLIVQLTHGQNGGEGWGNENTLPVTQRKKTTSFIVYSDHLTETGDEDSGFDWYACGY